MALRERLRGGRISRLAGGSSLAKQVEGQRPLLFFAIAAIALSMLRSAKGEGDLEVHITWPLVARLAPIGLVTGFAAGFFGLAAGPYRARPDVRRRHDTLQRRGVVSGVGRPFWGGHVV